MSKNTKDFGYKGYLQLLDRQSELQDQIRALGYRELEKPIHHGYTAYLTLREDVLKRKDGKDYQYIIDNFAYTTWSRTTDFRVKRKKKYEDNLPKLRYISESDYLKLDVRYHKFFHLHTRTYSSWNGNVYKFYQAYIPQQYLVINIKNHYLTHVKIIDGGLESELQFVNDKLWDYQQRQSPYNRGGFTYYRKHYTSTTRACDKLTLHRLLKDIDETKANLEFNYGTRSQAKWMYW